MHKAKQPFFYIWCAKEQNNWSKQVSPRCSNMVLVPTWTILLCKAQENAKYSAEHQKFNKTTRVSLFLKDILFQIYSLTQPVFKQTTKPNQTITIENYEKNNNVEALPLQIWSFRSMFEGEDSLHL